MNILIRPDGELRCVYDEALDLTSLGRAVIRRASHVEPDGAGYWWADLGPVSGPTLGPFTRRSAALQAETAWLGGHLADLRWPDGAGSPVERADTSAPGDG